MNRKNKRNSEESITPQQFLYIKKRIIDVRNLKRKNVLKIKKKHLETKEKGKTAASVNK